MSVTKIAISILFCALISVNTILQAAGFETYTEDWTDAAREGRKIPVKIYLPKTSPAKETNSNETEPAKPHPVVLLSHGLGGSREGFPYLGEFWAENGYVVIVVQHPGSDSSILKPVEGQTLAKTMQNSINAEAARNRFGDVKFVLDKLEELNKNDEKLKGRLDLERIALGGHSFGAHTTLGMLGRDEKRIKAGIAMSPNALDNRFTTERFKNVKVPVLHMTGTKDVSVIGLDTGPESRRVPFDKIESKGQYLLIFKDGNHMLFSGHPRPLGQSPLEKKYQPLIREIGLKFLDAYLKDDLDAKKWLQGNDCIERLGENATFEKK